MAVSRVLVGCGHGAHDRVGGGVFRDGVSGKRDVGGIIVAVGDGDGEGLVVGKTAAVGHPDRYSVGGLGLVVQRLTGLEFELGAGDLELGTRVTYQCVGRGVSVVLVGGREGPDYRGDTVFRDTGTGQGHVSRDFVDITDEQVECLSVSSIANGDGVRGSTFVIERNVGCGNQKLVDWR